MLLLQGSGVVWCDGTGTANPEFVERDDDKPNQGPATMDPAEALRLARQASDDLVAVRSVPARGQGAVGCFADAACAGHHIFWVQPASGR